jgi:hypothetical protein
MTLRPGTTEFPILRREISRFIMDEETALYAVFLF